MAGDGGRSSRPLFVGRDAEAAEVTDAIERAGGGRGGAVLISGEAGIGKTRLVTAVLDSASHPVHAGWGFCTEDETAPPLWPWRTALSSLGIDVESGAGGRFDLALRVTAELRDRRGAVLVIDDAHWADPSSVRFLDVLAPMLHTTPAVLIVTYRPADVESAALQQALATLERAPGTRAMSLSGIDTAATAALLAAVAPATPTSQLVTEVQARTGGNPFFVIQVGRLLPDSGAGQPIPVAVRDAVRRRLNRLSPECNDLLRAAAVLGELVDVAQLEHIAGTPADDAGVLLDAALAAQVIGDAGENRVRFLHALVRETLLSELPARTRASLHLSLAELIERTSPESLEALAFHFAEAALAGGGPKAMYYYRECARVAQSHREYAAEARFLGHAVRLAEHDPELADLAPLVLDRSRALYRAGDLRGAWRGAVAAATRARRTERGDLVAAAAITVRGVGDPDLNREILGLCDECLAPPMSAALSPALRTSVEAQRLMAQLHLRMPVPEQRAAEVLDEAERGGDHEALALTLQLRHMTLDHPSQVRERLALARRAAAVAAQAGDNNLESWATGWEVDALFQLASRPELDRAIDRLVHLAEESGEMLMRWHALMARASVAMLEGRFADTLSLAGDAAQIAVAGGHMEGLFVERVVRSSVGMLTGDAADIAATVPPSEQAARPEIRGYLAMVHAGLGRDDEARADLRVAMGSLDGVAEDSLYQQWLCVLVLAAWMLGEPDGAAELRSRLEPFSGQMSAVSRGQGGTLGLVDHFLALAARLEGDVAAAVTYLERAVECADRVGARPSAASSRCELAAALADGGGDIRRADALVHAALAEARALGMHPLVRRAESLAGRLRARAPVLSPRERQVAELVAAGQTNRQIGAQLFLSERTVENHVRSILDKLGFSSRTQVAAWFASHVAPEPKPAPRGRN